MGEEGPGRDVPLSMDGDGGGTEQDGGGFLPVLGDVKQSFPASSAGWSAHLWLRGQLGVGGSSHPCSLAPPLTAGSVPALVFYLVAVEVFFSPNLQKIEALFQSLLL